MVAIFIIDIENKNPESNIIKALTIDQFIIRSITVLIPIILQVLGL
ncbi:MAG: hypothetical protein ACTSP4_09935 [Candidatus Hodarchaeales archaeon]